RQRVGVAGEMAGRAGFEDRRHAGPEAARAEDEQVHRVGDEREPDDHLEGARPEQQPHAGSDERTDADGENEFHQASPASAGAGGTGSASVPMRAGRCVRMDWWASAMRMSTVAPTTSRNTPRSKRSALAM